MSVNEIYVRREELDKIITEAQIEMLCDLRDFLTRGVRADGNINASDLYKDFDATIEVLKERING